MPYTIERDAISRLIRQRYPNGGERVLLVGPPGTGKTQMAVEYGIGYDAMLAAPVVVRHTHTPAARVDGATWDVMCTWAKCEKLAEPGFKHCESHNLMLRALGREPVAVEGYTPPVVAAAEEHPVELPTLAPVELLTGEEAKRPWWMCYLTSETLESRIWTGLYPNRVGGMDEAMGAVAKAWVSGGLAIVNELCRGSADTLERMLGALDDSAFAADTSPLGTILRPDVRFGCIATQNAPSTVLSDALRDRFHMRIIVNKPNSKALAKLDDDVRIYIERSYDSLSPLQWEEGPRPSYRDCLSFTDLRHCGMPDEIAAQLVLDDPGGQGAATWLEALGLCRSEVTRFTASQDMAEIDMSGETVPF